MDFRLGKTLGSEIRGFFKLASISAIDGSSVVGWTVGGAWWGCATLEVAEVAEIEENPPETDGPSRGGDLMILVTKSAETSRVGVACSFSRSRMGCFHILSRQLRMKG
ncbi:hypothetical protein DM860_010013 [Cuscuta australis]|uniref:Uncharacterized protein n=1 Tax=Cuscuta australis TaxID=267555 RepID=A0A328DA74_9ASTE|nr:hypothetical protein DM860_010013 [Cuscuta australis]